MLHKDGTLVVNCVGDKVLIFIYNNTMCLTGAINHLHC